MKNKIINSIAHSILIVFITAVTLSPINAKAGVLMSDFVQTQEDVFTDAASFINNWLNFDAFKLLSEGVLMSDSKKRR